MVTDLGKDTTSDENVFMCNLSSVNIVVTQKLDLSVSESFL